jgi:hypothetical protein
MPPLHEYQNQTTTYPNPAEFYSTTYETPIPEFYTHDQALPFSPSTTGFNHAHAQPGQPIYRGLREGVDDMVFSTFPGGLQSPTVAFGNSIANSNGARGASRPASARWGGFDMGEQVTFEGLGFNEHDMMLNEYGSALAQVDDTSMW